MVDGVEGWRAGVIRAFKDFATAPRRVVQIQ